MLIQEILQELFAPTFEPALENHWVKYRDDEDFRYLFQVSDREYVVKLVSTYDNPELYEVTFSYKTPGGRNLWDITGSGGSHQVFELVAYSIRDAVRTGLVHGLLFTAKEPSRRRLYSVLAANIAKLTGWKNRGDLAAWINTSNEQAYLIADTNLIKKLENARAESGQEHKPTPEPVRQPDTFGALPVRFDS